ncbi:alanine:cation symporter family protein, partial [Phocaeicola vulgatus]|uniref:alanine:cation symporter family protein n=1 Tax=Phocaeicola vulgatus TaxID=821 RepID=UPI00210A9782
LVLCTCTAFIILFSGVGSTKEAYGIKLTQMALNNEIGNIVTIYVAVAILFFAYSSILGNFYYVEANVRYITHRKWAI